MQNVWRLIIYVEIAMWFRTLPNAIKEDSGATSIEYGVIDALSIGCRDHRVDRHGRLDEHDGLGGVASGDDGGRWLNGINGVYPRLPPVDVTLGLRAGFPGIG